MGMNMSRVSGVTRYNVLLVFIYASGTYAFKIDCRIFYPL